MKKNTYKPKAAYEPALKPLPTQEVISKYLSNNVYDNHKSELRRDEIKAKKGDFVRPQRNFVMGVEHFISRGDSMNLITYPLAMKIIPDQFKYKVR